MAEVDDLIVRVRAKGHDLWLAGPQPAEAIAALEGALGVVLPPSYQNFLIRFGGAAIYDSTVSGIIDGQPLDETAGSLYGDTRRFREDRSLPDHLLVVQPDDDAPYCLDTSTRRKDGEFPVVCFELHSKHAGKIAEDFGTWFRQWFLRHWAEDDA